MSSITKSRRLVRASRALGVALTPKAEKYLNKRAYGPGQHGKMRRTKGSDYALRLREKQKLRLQYQLREKQLRKVYEIAKKSSGLTGEVMIEYLDHRLDALVLRGGFARTIMQARQLVTHRHILVDGQIVDRPGFQVKVGQTIQVKPTSQILAPFQVAAKGSHLEVLAKVPEYLEVSIEKLTTKLVREPLRSEIPIICNEQFVVEYYAR
jgi:small subunit ribosomal protein S4